MLNLDIFDNNSISSGSEGQHRYKITQKIPQNSPSWKLGFLAGFWAFFAKMAKISVGPRDHIQKKFIGYSYAEPMGFIEEF